MKTIYFDLVSGASGDMILGALVDAGLPFAVLRDALGGLDLPEFELTQERVLRGAFAATKIHVKTADTAHSRGLAEIVQIIATSHLPAVTQTRALRVFRRIAEAEAGIHDVPVEKVHFHEIGAVDTIVDVAGALMALELLGIEHVAVSPVPLGRGMLTGAHGRMPLPAPATVALLRGVPVVGVDVPLETVTPTAAALLAELADSFGPIPAMRLTAVGYGAGSRTAPEPNVLRVLLGETSVASSGAENETLSLLETNIDDMTPEICGYVVERLLASGALDAYLTPILMKKVRPAVLLSVLCRPSQAAELRGLIFRETSTLGIRTQEVTRHCLARASVAVDTPYGRVRVKVAQLEGSDSKAAPEYEDCRQVAQAGGVPLRSVYEAALLAYAQQGHAVAGEPEPWPGQKDQ
jgi:pyridinium-3,5-bisthiocarboxylic acid mononucleotide nickel chelatase